MSGATGIRHTAQTVAQARTLIDGGWTAYEVARMLGVSHGTVRRWTDDTYQQHATDRFQRINARRRAASMSFRLPVSTPEAEQAFMVRLATERVPSTSIAKVCTVLLGRRVSRAEVLRAVRGAGVAG